MSFLTSTTRRLAEADTSSLAHENVDRLRPAVLGEEEAPGTPTKEAKEVDSQVSRGLLDIVIFQDQDSASQQDQDQVEICSAEKHNCKCPASSSAAPLSSLVIATWDVHCLRLQRQTESFRAKTGISVTIECIEDYDQFHADIISDAKTQTGLWDGFKFGPHIVGEMDLLGGLTDLTPFVKENPTLKWNDIFRFNRENGAVWDKKVVVIPLDGDVLSFYYRTDLFEKYNKQPPNTWEQYTELAKFFNGKEELIPGTNETAIVAGSCVTRADRPQYWTILIMSSMTQYQGTQTGALFDPETMEPLLGEAFVRALQYMEEQFVYGSDSEFEGMFQEVNLAEMNEGRCAMTYDWGDSFTEHAKAPPTSLISGYLGTAQTPGSRTYLNRETMLLEPCTEELCSCGTFPGNTEGCINSAPYAAFTGWSGGCNNYASPEAQLACAQFFAHVSSPDISLIDTIPNVTVGAPFISSDPFRISQTDVDAWVDRGLPRESVTTYLETIKEQLSDPNTVLDMRIPATKAFLNSMNVAFRKHITKIKENKDAGKVGEQLFSTDDERWQMEGQVRQEWLTIIADYNEVNTPELLDIYQKNLGVYKETVDMNYLTDIRPAGFTLAGVAMAASIFFAGWTWYHRRHRLVLASQPLFLWMLCAGTFVLASTIIPLSVDDSIASERGASIACMSVPWLCASGFTVTFSALFSKIWRVNKLLKHAANFSRVTVTEEDVLKPFFILMVLNVGLLTSWTVVDPLHWDRVWEENAPESYGRCISDGKASKYFLSFILVVNVSALILANVQAYKANNKNLNLLLSESTYIALSMASIFQASAIGIPLLVLVKTNPTANYFVRSGLIFVIAMSVQLLMFCPKMIAVRQNDVGNSTVFRSKVYSSTVFGRPSSQIDSPVGDVSVPTQTPPEAAHDEEKVEQNAGTDRCKSKSNVDPETTQKLLKLKELLEGQGIETSAYFVAAGFDP